jgi:hypothetical protein
LQQAGNEVSCWNFSDDGAGLNLACIRERGLQLGLIQSYDTSPDEAALIRLIFAPGFFDRQPVTELSGRGVGGFNVVPMSAPLAYADHLVGGGAGRAVCAAFGTSPSARRDRVAARWRSG